MIGKYISKEIQINFGEVAKKVISQMYEEIKTSQIDELIAETCIHLSTLNPNYGEVAKKIIKDAFI